MLMKLEFSQQIFEKYSNVKFRDNLSSESQVFPSQWTGTHDEAYSRLSQS